MCFLHIILASYKILYYISNTTIGAPHFFVHFNLVLQYPLDLLLGKRRV